MNRHSYTSDLPQSKDLGVGSLLQFLSHRIQDHDWLRGKQLVINRWENNITRKPNPSEIEKLKSFGWGIETDDKNIIIFPNF